MRSFSIPFRWDVANVFLIDENIAEIKITRRRRVGCDVAFARFAQCILVAAEERGIDDDSRIADDF